MSVTINPLYADCEVDVTLLTVEQAEREITQCMIGVEPGDSLEIIVSDPKAADELIEWAKASGHLVLGTSSDSDCERIYLERQY